ncbi:MAG: signal recognition particle-docking protein FtsY [Nanoarchaeota archaeon]
MFNKLKEKLSNWAKKLTKDTEEKQEEIVETQEEEKPQKKKILKTSGKIKEIEIPTKLDAITGIRYPDIEKLKEIEKDLEEVEEKQGFFSKIKSKFTKIKITDKEFDVYSEELEMLLLENNVALEVAEKIIKHLREAIIGKELLKKEIESEIKDSLKEIIEEILIEPFSIYEKIKEKKSNPETKANPYVILFCGINGTGKTTTIAKIAYHLKKQGLSCVIAAADTFRAASIEQLKEHSEKLGIKLISQDYQTDPASVGFDAIKYAKKNAIDCVLIDTAGRMHTAKNLLKEIEKIAKVAKPDLKLFIGESITGNDAIEQIKSFDWHIGIDGIILTKADIDEKGGTALSLGYIAKKPILYLGTGQLYDNIEPFNKEKFIQRLGL